MVRSKDSSNNKQKRRVGQTFEETSTSNRRGSRIGSRMSAKPRAKSRPSSRRDCTRDDDDNNLKTGYVKLNPKVALVRPFIEATLKKGIPGLKTEYRKMKRENDFTKMSVFVAQTTEGRNRYKDVGCLDNSRVVLSLGPNPYIHANYVSTHSDLKKFICTQGPLTKTQQDFWYMVVQENSKAILMLCNFMEMGTNKCARYFPESVGTTLEFDNGNIRVKALSIAPFPFPLPTKVRVMVTQLEVQVYGMPAHQCTHYHWLDWPDRGVPEADTAPISILGAIRDKRTPTIVHCSAGIGRTGSLVLIDHAMELIHSGISLESMNVYLEQMRAQRNNSIQTDQQYLYVHQVLLIYFRRVHYMDTNLYHAWDAFSKEYVKATA